LPDSKSISCFARKKTQSKSPLHHGAQFNPLDKGGGEQNEPGDFGINPFRAAFPSRRAPGPWQFETETCGAMRCAQCALHSQPQQLSLTKTEGKYPL
jgi:hypothetical protein